MSLAVADTILAQLGGRRFATMTGSKFFVGDESSLRFKVGSNGARVTHCAVSYVRAADTYVMTFLRMRGTQVRTVATYADVYADMLQPIFTHATGLDTRL